MMADIKKSHQQSKLTPITYSFEPQCQIKICSDEKTVKTADTSRTMACTSCAKGRDATSKRNVTCCCADKNSMINLNVPIVCILGGPGCGKGTQCEKIITKYNLVHLSTGDLVRDEVESRTPRSKELSSTMERGELVPNEIIMDLLRSAIKKNKATARGFVLDGYPREKSQGVAFETTIAPITTILFFEAKPDVLVQRIMFRSKDSGRIDDNEECITKRLDTFNTYKNAILDQFKDKVVKINAERDADTIFGDVQKTLDPIFNMPSGQKKGVCGCTK